MLNPLRHHKLAQHRTFSPRPPQPKLRRPLRKHIQTTQRKAHHPIRGRQHPCRRPSCFLSSRGPRPYRGLLSVHLKPPFRRRFEILRAHEPRSYRKSRVRITNRHSLATAPYIRTHGFCRVRVLSTASQRMFPFPPKKRGRILLVAVAGQPWKSTPTILVSKAVSLHACLRTERVLWAPAHSLRAHAAPPKHGARGYSAVALL